MPAIIILRRPASSARTGTTRTIFRPRRTICCPMGSKASCCSHPQQSTGQQTKSAKIYWGKSFDRKVIDPFVRDTSRDNISLGTGQRGKRCSVPQPTSRQRIYGKGAQLVDWYGPFNPSEIANLTPPHDALVMALDNLSAEEKEEHTFRKETQTGPRKAWPDLQNRKL